MRDGAIQLGGSELRVLRIGFGCEQLGGYDWGAVDLGEVEAAVELAVAEGVTLFDTADCYGRGESERRLGRLLASHRERVQLATKFGVRFSNDGTVWYDSSPAWARQALHDSLVRLGTDYVDLLQMHYWDGRTSLPALFESLERLREAGRIRYYGICNCVPTGVRFADYPGLVSASLEYSLLERSQAAAAREFGRTGVTFLAYGSLAQGLLSGKYGPADRFGAADRRSRQSYRHFHGEAVLHNSRVVEALRALAATLAIPPARLAVAWILDSLPGSVALVGIKRPQQLRDVLPAVAFEVTPAIRAALETVAVAGESTN